MDILKNINLKESIGLINGIQSKRFSLVAVYLFGMYLLSSTGFINSQMLRMAAILSSSLVLIFYIIFQTWEEVAKQNNQKDES